MNEVSPCWMFARLFGKSAPVFYAVNLLVGMLIRSGLRYTDNYVTDSEFSSLPPRLQDALRRTATNNQNNSAGWNMYYTPAQVPNRYKRIGASKSGFVS